MPTFLFSQSRLEVRCCFGGILKALRALFSPSGGFLAEPTGACFAYPMPAGVIVSCGEGAGTGSTNTVSVGIIAVLHKNYTVKETHIINSTANIPIWEKLNLTLTEAAEYSGIGINKIRDISNDPNCPFVLWVGKKRLIKRRLFDAYLERAYSI